MPAQTSSRSGGAGRVPPQNIEAEESVLGAMLVTAPALEAALDEERLEPRDFYLDRHGLICEVTADLHRTGAPVDPLTVCNALQRRGKIRDAGGKLISAIDKAGGKHYVSELAAKVPAAGNAKHYAEIVKECAGLRGVIREAQRAIEAAHEGRINGEVGDLTTALSAFGRGGAVEVRTADLSRVRPIRWAWDQRLLLGYLNLLLGAEGVGKGTLTAWLIAELTKGGLPGDLAGEPARVLILGDEDAFDSVWVPRLYANGADLGLVDTLEDEFDLAGGAEPLRALVEQGGYRVLYFDQLLDNLGVDVDDWRSKDVRDRLRPLRRVARELDVLILGALHPNKGQRGSFRDLVSGSHAFNASSRSSLLLAPHPEDQDRRILVRGKGNLSAAPPSFEFAIEGRDLEINGHCFSLPVVSDEGDGELTIDDVLKPQRDAPVRSTIADEIDAIGTGKVQKRAEIAQALGRSSDDRSIGRALDQLEAEDRWEKVGRGQWKATRLGIGISKEMPMSNQPAVAVEGSGS